MEHKTAQKYLNQVRHFLVCDKTDQKRLLEQCKNLINSFQQENPDAEFAEVVTAFGKPQDCAADLLSTLDDTKVAAAQKKRRRFQRIAIAVVSVLIIVSVSTAVFWYSKYSYQREFDDEFILVIEPPVEGTLEEFWAAKEQEAQFNGDK